MHIAFVDESGDVGVRNSPTRHFVLCAAVVDHVHWAAANRELGAMRERLRATHGLRLDAEIHASEFLGGSPLHLGLDYRRRFQCARHILRTLRKLPGMAFARIAVRKQPETAGVLEVAWSRFLRSLDEQKQRVPSGGCPSRGLMIVCDHHAASPYRPSDVQRAGMSHGSQLLDLPYGRNSRDNLLLQAADLLAYLTKQSIEPGVHFSKSRGRALIRESERLFPTPCQVIDS